MAAEAAHIIAMGATVITNVHGGLMMTFDTVGVRQGDSRDLAKTQWDVKQQREKQQRTCRQTFCVSTTHHGNQPSKR